MILKNYFDGDICHRAIHRFSFWLIWIVISEFTEIFIYSLAKIIVTNRGKMESKKDDLLEEEEFDDEEELEDEEGSNL